MEMIIGTRTEWKRGILVTPRLTFENNIMNHAVIYEIEDTLNACTQNSLGV